MIYVTTPSQPLKRILIKISGEVLLGDTSYGIDPQTTERVASELVAIHKSNIELALVIGGGNIFRGVKAASQGLDRATGDYIGMLATVINALALQAALEKLGAQTRVLSAINIQALCEPYIRRRAVRHLEKGRIVIFASGTGNPFFTTDTAASLRAIEIGADAILKATKVDGVYDDDPQKNKQAQRFTELSYQDVLRNDLSVMDAAAVSLCRENKMPILVFDMTVPGNIERAVQGQVDIGTWIREKE